MAVARKKSHMEVSKGAAWKSLELLMLLEMKLLFSHQHLLKKLISPRSQLVALQIEVFSVSLHRSLHGSITSSSGVFNLSVCKYTCCCVIF